MPNERVKVTLKSRDKLLLLSGGILLLVCIYGLALPKLKTFGTVPMPNGPTITYSIDKPSEKKVDPNSVYTVAANQPRRIILPSINSEGFVQAVGIDQHGAIAVPANIHVAGWFVQSVTPGDAGLSIIDGHIRGRYAGGIFEYLQAVHPGDSFIIEFGDLSLRNFSVISINQIKAADATSALHQKNSEISNQLNVITCGGKFNKILNAYEDRIIVVAKLTD